MLPWIFNRNLTIFEAIEDTKERQFVCARSKRPHASASAGHVENFKTTISKNVISRRIYIYMYISPKKLTVSPPFFRPGIGNRTRPIYHRGKGAETTFFSLTTTFHYLVRVLGSFPPPPPSLYPYRCVKNVQRDKTQRGYVNKKNVMKRYRSCNARNLNDLIWVTVGGSARCVHVRFHGGNEFFFPLSFLFSFRGESEEENAKRNYVSCFLNSVKY